MKDYLNKLSPELKGLIHLAASTASKNNMRAYLVGGFVRDLILGVRNFDLDIVIEGDGVKFAEEFAKELRTIPTCHRRFGTATCAIFDSKLKVDIASARKEIYPHPGDLPRVRGGTLEEDSKRRDFTINAMAISINEEDFGRFIDFYNGMVDLKQKKIRILHDLSFIDDPTRLLRAIRFEKRYDFRIESKTLECLGKAVKLKMLDKVGPQRVRDELVLILKEVHPIKVLKRIQELIGCSFISPRLCIQSKTYKLLSSIEEQINWFKQKFPDNSEPRFWLIYFMGMIESLDINGVKFVCRKFVFRKEEEKIILTYKNDCPEIIKKLNRSRIRPSTIFRLFEPLSYEAIIFIKALHKSRYTQIYIEDFFKVYNGVHIYVSGNDLKKLGITPGPNYQKIFKRVLNAKLNGAVKTKEDELTFINKLRGLK
jgi:tRNA nucleotidyltransferase (CCA-adding enzyme)